MSSTVEILLASYQGQDYIEEQIGSILNQSFGSFKLIIRDDASTDLTVDIIKKLALKDSRIALLKGEERLGVTKSFEALMLASSAKYLFFSDQDDIWHQNKLDELLLEMKNAEKLHGKNRPILIHSDLVVVDRELKTIAPSFWKQARLYPEKAFKLSHLLLQNPVTGCTMLINRPLLLKSLPIPSKAVLHDHWIALVAASFGRRVSINQAFVDYRQHGKNVLGASAFLPLTYVVKGIKKVFGSKSALLSLFDQARVFHERYAKDLNEKDLKALGAFLTLPKKGFFHSRALLYKYALYKQGAIRNIGLFFTSFKNF